MWVASSTRSSKVPLSSRLRKEGPSIRGCTAHLRHKNEWWFEQTVAAFDHHHPQFPRSIITSLRRQHQVTHGGSGLASVKTQIVHNAKNHPKQSAHDAGYLALSSDANGSHDAHRVYPPEDPSSSSTEPLVSQWTGIRWSNNNIQGGSFTVQPDGQTYTYAYGPKGLAGLRHNYYALLCAFFASIGGLEFGYDQGVVRLYTYIPFLGFLFVSWQHLPIQIANVLVMRDFMERWPITPLQKGIMSEFLF